MPSCGSVRVPMRVFMRAASSASSGWRLRLSAQPRCGAQAVKLDSGVGSTCTRRTPIATLCPGRTSKRRCSCCVRVTCSEALGFPVAEGQQRRAAARRSRPHAQPLQRAGEHHARPRPRGEVAAAQRLARGGDLDLLRAHHRDHLVLARRPRRARRPRPWRRRSGCRRECGAPGCRFAAPRKVATKRVAGREYSSCGRAHLQQAPEVHDADAVGHREGLFLVVRHQHRGDARARAAPGGWCGAVPRGSWHRARRRAHRAAAPRACGRARAPPPRAAAGRRRAAPAAARRAPRAPPAAAAPCAAGGARARACAARAARTRCSPPRSCAGTARSSGTPGPTPRLRAATCVTSRPCREMRP